MIPELIVGEVGRANANKVVLVHNIGIVGSTKYGTSPQPSRDALLEPGPLALAQLLTAQFLHREPIFRH